MTNDVAQASYYDSRAGSGAGLAVLHNRQRSTWRTLPKATMGNVLVQDDAIAEVAAMLRILVELDDMLPEQFAPAIAIEPTSQLRIGRQHHRPALRLQRELRIVTHPMLAPANDSTQDCGDSASGTFSLVPWIHEKPPGIREIALEQVF